MRRNNGKNKEQMEALKESKYGKIPTCSRCMFYNERGEYDHCDKNKGARVEYDFTCKYVEPWRDDE